MKKISLFLALMLVISLLAGCGPSASKTQIAATTLPVYDFTRRILEGTDLSATRLVTEQVSCLHDYSLNVSQVRASESAETIVISGAGLESFLGDLLNSDKVIDASQGLTLLPGEHGESDPHIWLSPENAKSMAQNICDGLTSRYPQHQAKMEENLTALLSQLDALQAYGKEALRELSCREIITFHDGFAYLAQAFDLTILKSIEEEHGSEASAKDLSQLIELVNTRKLPALFTEANGSDAAASVIAGETGARVFQLTTAMSGDDYFSAMRANIDALKEALK